MNINYDDLFQLYAGFDPSLGWPAPGDSDESNSEDEQGSQGHIEDSDLDNEPAPPYQQDTAPRPFRLENMSWVAPQWGSTGASSRAAPSRADLGPLTRSGRYYSLRVLFKPMKVRVSFYALPSSCSD